MDGLRMSTVRLSRWKNFLTTKLVTGCILMKIIVTRISITKIIPKNHCIIISMSMNFSQKMV